MIFEKQKTINEIAYDLGFTYPQHFSRMFKKIVGVSPSHTNQRIQIFYIRQHIRSMTLGATRESS